MSPKLSLLIFLVAPVAAQVGTSTLTGRIVDATPAPIPGADVKVVNEASGSSLVLRSNGDGIYQAPALLPGTTNPLSRALIRLPI